MENTVIPIKYCLYARKSSEAEERQALSVESQIKEIKRFNQLKNTVTGMSEEEKSRERKPDIRTYAKYLLKEGTLQEKRDLVQSFKSRLVLLNKRVVLE